MIGPVTFIARKIALHKHASKEPTGILPLSKVRRATVFVDMVDAEGDKAKKDIQHFFEPLGIEVMVLTPLKWDINYFGWMKKKNNPDFRNWGEDLFISLADKYNFTAEYAARCSRARFKAGHEQLAGNLFDLVVTNPEHSLPRQPEIFSAIKAYLIMIQ